MFLDLLRILQVVFGIGLVIFVHEAGHFIAARLCGVRADVFSLGFGPRMFGFRRGGTLYQVAWLPLGGYVKMAGEYPEPGHRPASDELHSKTVGQRFFIYSGGVIMNVIFALVVFPIVLAAGVPVLKPVIAAPTKGMPAWQAGIPEGTEILSIDGAEVYDFFHIPNEVALADPGPVEFKLRLPGQAGTTTRLITPVYSEEGGFRQIGVRPGLDPQPAMQVQSGGAAERAGIQNGDRLVSVQSTSGQHDESANPGDQLQTALFAGEHATINILRGATHHTYEITPDEQTSETFLFGIEPVQNIIQDMRTNPWLQAMGLQLGGRLLSIAGRAIQRPKDVGLALSSTGLSGFTVVQETTNGEVIQADVSGWPTEAELSALLNDLHLSYDPESSIALPSPGRAAETAGLPARAAIVSVAGNPVQSWAQVLKWTRKLASKGDAVEFEYRLEGAGAGTDPLVLSITPLASVVYDFGISLERAQAIYQTQSVGESIRAGAHASWRFLTDSWMTLKKMFMRQVSTENLGGIITISTVSYDWASQGWTKLFFFLCMLSINLAFLNVLPIPVLDGGHLAFCLVEAVKGSPVSERTLGYSQVIGLVVILTLTVYVTYQDVLRLLPTGP